MIDDDERLLRAVADADAKSLEALYGRYGQRIFHYAQTFVRDRGAAEEIVTDTMLAVWQGARRFDGGSRVSTWILGIARHKALDAVRRRSTGDALDTLPERISEAPGPEEQIARGAAQRQMRAALTHLSPEHREVLWLAFFEDLPYPQIAQLLQIPHNTVKTRIYYAKRKLRVLLDPAIGAGSTA